MKPTNQIPQSGKPGSEVATVAAGGKIKLQWDTWPESHHGPVLDYLAKCAGDDCTSVEAGDLSFFKIDEKGLNDAASQNWASDDLIKNDFAWTVTVPEDIAPGQYVLRHEIIALHSAQDTNGAQNYPQCINIKVTGSGTAEPAGVVATELYTASDPGISLSIYNSLTDYEIPGPAVYSGGASGSAPSTGGSSSGSSSSKDASSAPAATSSAPYSTSNSTTQASAPTSTEAATTSESAPEPIGEPTFAGSSPASSTSCTTTITLTGSSAATASATQSSTPIETSDNSDDESEDDSEEESSDNSSSGSSSGSSNNTPTTTTAPAADISAVASSLPSSVLDAPIPTATSSSDKSDGKPSKALPEGFTLKDLLEWVNYLLSKAYNSEGKHARDVTRR
jgi:cellulase